MAESRKKLIHRLKLPVALLALVWGMFVLDVLLPWSAALWLGLVPRSVAGLRGIVGMPFVHANWAHLGANSVPLAVLSTLVVLTGRGAGTIASVGLLGGAALWLIGRGDVLHVGASGLVYGLAVFLVGVGIVERRLVPLAVALGVVIVYGGALLSGVLPTQTGVSWDGHLAGGIGGGLVASRVRPRRRETKTS